jgi:O-antigen ligase
MDLYGLAWKAFATHPLLGVGLNNFSVISNALHGLDTVPHNLELGYLAELGLPGLVLALVWIFTLGRSVWGVRRAAREPADRAMGLGLWAAWLAFVLHNQMESTIYGEQFKLLLMLVAAATWRLEVAARDRERVAARAIASSGESRSGGGRRSGSPRHALRPVT